MNSGGHSSQGGGRPSIPEAEPMKVSLELASFKMCKWMVWYDWYFILPNSVEFPVDAGIGAPLTTLKLRLEPISNSNSPADKNGLKLTYECCSLRANSLLYDTSVSVDDGGDHPSRTIHESELSTTGGSCMIPHNLKNHFITLEITLKFYRNRHTGTVSDIWNNRHPPSLTLDMLKSGHHTDVKIISKDGQEFNAHRLILTARNDVFDAMFKHDMVESTTGIVKMDDLSAKAVTFLLNFIYSSQILKISPKEEDDEVEEDATIAEVLYLADKFGLDELKTFLDENIGKFCVEGNVWHLFKLCKLYSLQKGKKVIFDVLKAKNADSLEEFVFSHV